MSYQNKIYTLIKASWPLPAGASSASQASVNDMATEVAEAVANSVQADLVAALDNVVTALNTFMSAVQSTPIIPNDGGAKYKAGLSIVAIPVKTSLSTLASKIAAFQ